MIIRWLTQVMSAVVSGWCDPLVLQPDLVRRHVRSISRTSHYLVWALLIVSPVLTVDGVGAEVFSAPPAAAKKIVAAGIGFQNADSSSITVRTYDADTGEVLSDDTYDLDIKEDTSASAGQGRERIFAGGVGVGADGLSEFSLRVYDAADGRFLWEGRLNLKVDGDVFGPVLVTAQMRPGAVLRLIAQRAPLTGQPYFLLRAMNPDTGKLAWSDQFSTELAAMARTERIGRSSGSMTGMSPRDIDFRIRMFDEEGRHLLWEDKIAPATEGDNPHAEQGSDAAAGLLPGSSEIQSELSSGKEI